GFHGQTGRVGGAELVDAAGEVARLGEQAGGGGPVAVALLAVAADAVLVVDELAALDEPCPLVVVEVFARLGRVPLVELDRRGVGGCLAGGGLAGVGGRFARRGGRGRGRRRLVAVAVVVGRIVRRDQQQGHGRDQGGAGDEPSCLALHRHV